MARPEWARQENLCRRSPFRADTAPARRASRIVRATGSVRRRWISVIRPGQASELWPTGRWASCSVTSARVRSTPSANPSSTRDSPSTPSDAYGVASVVFWSLVVVISMKYLFLVMRADNHGEGGILALTAARDAARAAARPTRIGAAIDHARGVRHRAALRRRPDHARDLGALGRRGFRGRDIGVRRLGDPGLDRDPGRAVRRSAPRHRRDRSGVQPDHGRVVHRARGARDCARS